MQHSLRVMQEDIKNLTFRLNISKTQKFKNVYEYNILKVEITI